MTLTEGREVPTVILDSGKAGTNKAKNDIVHGGRYI